MDRAGQRGPARSIGTIGPSQARGSCSARSALQGLLRVVFSRRNAISSLRRSISRNRGRTAVGPFVAGGKGPERVAHDGRLDAERQRAEQVGGVLVDRHRRERGQGEDVA
jgi:hypothetical protein